MIKLIKRIKLLYVIYNFFHRKELSHNEIIFENYGIKKKYYSTISSKDFSNYGKPPAIHLDKERLRSCKLFSGLSDTSKESLLSFGSKGYAILENYLSPAKVDTINEEISSLVKKRQVTFTNGRKIMMAIHVSPLLRGIGNDHQLKELLSVLLDGNPILFQSINFLFGSEQPSHSDSIHMTTFPLGGLLGAWFALEDITEENGPLHYYPHSHSLPYYLNGDYDNDGNRFLLGKKSYAAYEKMITEKIREHQLKKEKFLAHKGDLLIWHANLFHGGEPHLNKAKTRKSMVFHYFKENGICYHEITQRPALLKKYSDK